MVVFLISGMLYALDIRKLDGFDWQNMPDPDKARYATGFLTGLDVFQLMQEDLGRHKNREVREYIELLNHYLKYDTDFKEVVRRVNYFYERNPQYLEWPVQQVIIVMFKKNWWKFQ
jgi:hypothetical protein